MTTAVVELGNIIYNLHQSKTLVQNGRVYAVLSADAYGHGAIPVSRALEPLVDGFAVSRPYEAFELRMSGILRPIIVLAGIWSPADLRRLSREACDLVCHSEFQIKLLESLKLERPCTVWLELDIGLNSTGFRDVVDRQAAFERLSACPNIKQPPNFIARLSTTGNAEGRSIPEHELADFETFVKGKPGLKCIADASSLLLYPEEVSKDVVRLGRTLYGIWPLTWRAKMSHDRSPRRTIHLKPAMTLKAKLIAIRDCKRGEPVGFQQRPLTTSYTKLGVVSVGYGDGYPHHVPPETPVWINGRLCPIIDQPSMDTTIVDLGPDHQDHVGDEVILWGGDKLPLSLLAAKLNCAPEVLSCRLTKRVTRHISGAVL